MFDRRSLQHSTILYDSPETPLCRLAWNKIDTNTIACLGLSSGKIILVDIRSEITSICWILNVIDIDHHQLLLQKLKHTMAQLIQSVGHHIPETTFAAEERISVL